MSAGDVPPNQTIYVSNLPEKLKKEDLKKALYAVFGQFGRILDIVALKTFRLRGQAWIVFADVTSATNALRAMQAFPFFEKPMRLQYAVGKSDAVAKLDGSYKPRDKAAAQEHNKEEREKLKDRKQKFLEEHKRKLDQQAAEQREAAARFEEQRRQEMEENIPNKTLFVKNLPHSTTGGMLKMLFEQFPGFVEVRMIEQKPGIAFVDFEDEGKAAVARAGLQDFKISEGHNMQIAFAKR